MKKRFNEFDLYKIENFLVALEGLQILSQDEFFSAYGRITDRLMEVIEEWQ